MSLDDLRQQQQRRARLLNLTLFCTVTLAVVVLAACGPVSDVDIARSGVPVTEPTVVAMTAVPAERLVLPTTTTHLHPTSTVPLLDAVDPPAPRDVTPVVPANTPAAGDCGGWGDLLASYFPAEQLGKSCSVLQCESQGNPSAKSRTNDHGLFQLHAGSPGFPGGWQATFADVTGSPFFDGVYDPNLNVMFAAWLWHQSGWSPWACAR